MSALASCGSVPVNQSILLPWSWQWSQGWASEPVRVKSKSFPPTAAKETWVWSYEFLNVHLLSMGSTVEILEELGYEKDEYGSSSFFSEQKPVCKHWRVFVEMRHEGFTALFVTDTPKARAPALLAAVPNTLHDFKNGFPSSVKCATSKMLLFPSQILVSSKPITCLLEL